MTINSPTSAGTTNPLRVLLIFGIPFAILSLLIGLRVIAQTTLPHILVPGEYVNFQDVSDGLPVPRLLAWNLGFMDLLMSLRDLSGLSLMLAGIIVFGPLWLLAVRQINPTFRLFNQQTSHTASNLSAPLEFYGLIKASTLLLMLGLPLTAFWILVDFGESSASQEAGSIQSISSSSGNFFDNSAFGIIWLIRFVLLGAIFWAGFHREGIAGDFSKQEWNDARRLPALILRGALFGFAAYLVCRIGIPQHMEQTLLRLQTLGTLNISTWNWFVSRCLFAFTMIGFALGAIFVLLNSSGATRQQKALFFFVPLVALGAALLAQQAFTTSALASHLDIQPDVILTIPKNFEYRPDRPNSGVPDSPLAAQELAQQLNLPIDKEHKLPGRTLVLFDETQPLLAYQNSYTLDGLLPNKTSSDKVTNFLKERDYRTAYSWIAMKNFYNARLMQFDMTGAINIGLLDLIRCPHNRQFAHTLLQMFSVCAATSQNEALLDIWADESKFDFPDRDSRRLMGDLYRRFGDAEKALHWYRKADMPSSFLKRVQSEPVMFRDGQIEGTLLLNGKPLAGVQVAVVPTRMNGLPRGLEPLVYSARAQILSRDPRAATPLFPQFHTQPYSLRWLSAAATTDNTGHYRVDHLTEGAYSVLCTLPSTIHTGLPADDKLHITHPPRPFALNYTHPAENMGSTSIEYK